MSTPKKTDIRRALKELRALIDDSSDPCVQRIAYGMETAIRWSIEDTVGWPKPAKEAKLLAKMLRGELRGDGGV